MTGGTLSPLRFPTIAVLGAGHVGPTIARVALDAGYHVSIAASGDPEKIALITEVLAPGAEPRWAADAVERSDLVVLAIPLHKFAAFDPALVADKVVVDMMNYWPPIDGSQEMFDDRRYGSSEIVQRRLAQSRIVKTLNHIGYHELEADRRPAGSREHPPRVGSDGIELRRSRPGVSALLHAERDLLRPRRSHSRTRFQHRLVPPLLVTTLPTTKTSSKRRPTSSPSCSRAAS